MRFASTGSQAAWPSIACPRPVRALAARLRRPGPAARGFTLVEALAAIVVLALSLSALLSAHDAALRGTGAIEEHLQARLLAQSLLAQWTRSRAPHASSHGRSGRFTWSVSGAPVAGANREPGRWTLHELTVTVAWAPNRRIALTTLRLLGAP